VFPEATISYTYELKEFKSGTVRLAAHAGVPIIPVLLWGTQRMFPKGRKPDFTRGQTLAITVGEPMTIDAKDALGETARLRAEMSRLLDETIRAYPEMPRERGGCRAATAVRRRTPSRPSRCTAMSAARCWP
jgi:1-acyl-sn-glycerol-3-phosphate acyltransferase